MRAQVSKEDFRLMNNPAWTPDGQYLIGRKHFTGERSLGAGELWMYHKSGGAGLQLTKQKNDQQDLGEPALSPDGHYVYYSEDVSAGPYFQYNKNPHEVIYAIKRLDRRTGETETIVATPGGAVRPQPSPDGKSLAFVKRVRDKSVLHLVDLDTGDVRALWDGLSHDMQEAWAIFGPYANFAWTPDSKNLVIWAQGKLWRVDADQGTPTQIPFSAAVEQTVAQPLRFEQKLDQGSFEPKMIRDVATSPDGTTLVFHAVGHLWTKALPNGTPQRLVAENGQFEYQPAFSPDGRKLLYTTWSDAAQGALVERDLASGQTRTLTNKPGFYYAPTYSRDGSQIVYAKTAGGSISGNLNAGEAGIYLMPANGVMATRIAKSGSNPQFAADGQRVYFLTGNGLKKKLQSVGIHGEEPRDVFDLKYVDAVSLSPDGQWVAFTELFNAYVAPLPQTGAAIELSKDTKAIPLTQVSKDVGSYLHWSADSKALHWMVGRDYHSRDLKDAFAFVPGAPKRAAQARQRARHRRRPEPADGSPERHLRVHRRAPDHHEERAVRRAGSDRERHPDRRGRQHPRARRNWQRDDSGQRESHRCHRQDHRAGLRRRARARQPLLHRRGAAGELGLLRQPRVRRHHHARSVGRPPKPCSRRPSCSRPATWSARACSPPARSCTAPTATSRR